MDFLVLELAAAVEDECFAVSEEVLLLAADVEAEAVGWLEEVAAEARRAMLRAKRAVRIGSPIATTEPKVSRRTMIAAASPTRKEMSSPSST